MLKDLFPLVFNERILNFSQELIRLLLIQVTWLSVLFSFFLVAHLLMKKGEDPTTNR